MKKHVMQVVGFGLGLLLVSACSGGGGASDPESELTAKAAVEQARDHCGAQAEPGDGADTLTRCMSEEIVARCSDSGAACNDADAMRAPLIRDISQFCLLDTVANGILPSAVQCVRSGFAWGCFGLESVLHVDALSSCLTEQFSVFCSLPGSDHLQACAGGSVIAALDAPTRMMILRDAVAASFEPFCPADDGGQCRDAQLAALCGAETGAGAAAILPFCD